MQPFRIQTVSVKGGIWPSFISLAKVFVLAILENTRQLIHPINGYRSVLGYSPEQKPPHGEEGHGVLARRSN